jgi:hypothetical protein
MKFILVQKEDNLLVLSSPLMTCPKRKEARRVSKERYQPGD